jgi:hypothetical protein
MIRWPRRRRQALRDGNNYCIARRTDRREKIWSSVEVHCDLCRAMEQREHSIAALSLRLASVVLMERERTSKKPLIKFCGRLAFGSSSARKYLRMWGNCFQ